MNHDTRVALLLLAIGINMAAGCGLVDAPVIKASQPSSDAPPPCSGEGTSTAHLGAPLVNNAPAAAEVVTNGGLIYLKTGPFTHGTIMDLGQHMSTAIYIGPADTPPAYQGGAVTSATVKTSVREYEYVKVDLPAGRYWLLTSNSVNIILLSCTANGATGHPAPTPSAS